MPKRAKPPIRSNGHDGTEAPELQSDLLIVGIGASAGGIQALAKFFSNVSESSSIAYVVILHLSPNHDSKLAHVLQQTTSLPVEQVTSRVKIKPDHVYVVSPDHSLSMVDGHIVTNTLESDAERRAPVDIFFRTLADSHGPNAVGVILSGTGANGSMGLKRIKEFGGATFAQNPREAEFSEMPRNAIATELVDAILPVAEIPAKILNYKNNRSSVNIADEPEAGPEGHQNALGEIFTHIRLRTGHDFSHYKRPTMLRRIERRISVKNLPDIETYAAFIKENTDEAHHLLKDLLISVTNFFRDKKAFEALAKKVVPRLVSRRDSDRPIRVWVAGCATGEEAYSLAMILAEQTQEELGVLPVQIFATDIDEKAVAIAREGLYTLNDAADVSPERLKRFFSNDGNKYRVRREIREMVLFAQHNLLKDPPFSHLDLITCRNLMIYLDLTAQERVLETIHFALEPGGYLLMGSSESVDGAGNLFASFDKANHIYQSRNVTNRPLPVPQSVRLYGANLIGAAAGQPTPKADVERISYNDLHLKLLEEFAPPSVVVNPEYEIVHVSARAGRYLQFVGGEPTNNLLRLVPCDIRLELRGMLFQAVQQKENVEARGLQVKFNDRIETINLLVRPIVSEVDTSRGYILVVFEPTEDGGRTVKPAEYAATEPVAQQLEEELIRSRAQLQSALEQSEFQSEALRASNEELQAMNEELRSSSEELETSKEELQSMNEELTTVNQELKVKIDELSHTNNNFQNLINSIDIGVIFLDRSLRVNLFSPAASRIFNLIPSDIGRPLSDLTNRLVYSDLAHDADLVLENLQTVERSINTTDGEAFVMRVFPYRTDDDRINGVILTFVDDTARKRADRVLAETADLISGQKEAFQTAMSGRDLADSLAPLIRAARTHFGDKTQAAFYSIAANGSGTTTVRHIAGMDHEFAGEIDKLKDGPESLAAASTELGRAIIVSDVQSESRWRSWREFVSDRGYRAYWSFPVRLTGGPTVATFALYFDEPREPVAFDLEWAEIIAHAAAIIIDRHNEAVDRERVEKDFVFRGQLLDSVEQAVVATDLEGRVTYWNKFAEKMLGWTEKEALGRSVMDLNVPEPMLERGREIMDSLQQGKTWHGEFTLRRRDGSTFPAEVFDTPIADNSGRLIGIVGVSIDISERKQTLAALAASEERLRLMMEGFTDIALFTTDVEGMVTSWNSGAEKIFGFTANEMVGKQSADIIFTPEDREKGEARKERRVAMRDGKALDERWHMRKNGKRFFASGFMVRLTEGEKHIGFGKIAQDLSERERGQQAIRETEMLKRLVEAQEEERQRIARDLHDNMGQHLTALRLKLEGLKAKYATDPAMIAAIDDTQAQAKRVDDEVSFMTWELRPTALDNLGLKNALSNFVKEWSKNYEIEAEFHSARIRKSRLASDIEINLYRIAQEALNNVVKHAKASKVDVMLEFGKDMVVLIVEDNGSGFDIKATERRKGKENRLGLVGMRERAALLGGTLQIESARLKGTTVMARVPARVEEDKAPGRRKNKK